MIGHSLESDLKFLKLIHARCIDTSIIFPHLLGFPFRRSLKFLAVEHLRKFVQDGRRSSGSGDGSSGSGKEGHDSVEDAVVSMELVRFFMECGMDARYLREREELNSDSSDTDTEAAD